MFRPLKPHQLRVDLVVAAVFALVMVALEAVGVMSIGSLDALTGSVVALALAGALAVRRLSPGSSLTVAWGAAVVQMLAGLNPRPSDVAIFAVLYATAAYGRRRVFWFGLTSSVVGAVVITLYLLFAPTMNAAATTSIQIGFVFFAAALFALLLSWVTGALVRTARRAGESSMAKERAEAEAATEHERGRIARDMHDVVAHSLAVVIAQADGARYALAASAPAASPPESASPNAGTDAAADALTTIASTARSALTDVRLLLTQLRHSEGAGPQPTLADLDALFGEVRAAGLDVRIDIDPAPQGSPGAAVQLAVFRILQEALTNALRHGEGGEADVSLAWHADRVQLAVTNRIDPASAALSTPGTGHGLVGMRERAQLAGGTVETGAEGHHFVVRAMLPVGRAA